MKYSFVFVCQQGELEIKSLLLAASLKQSLHGDYELIAALPEPVEQWGKPAEDTLKLLTTLGVRTAVVTNRISQDYPIGNKIDCLAVETDADKLFFLDSDMLCLQSWQPDEALAAPVLHAKPVDLSGQNVINETVWQQLYDLFQLPLPDRRVMASVSADCILPYFNAGVVGIPTGQGFARVWEQVCQTIHASPLIEERRRWLDQLALPIALVRMNLPFVCLNERYNFPAHLKPLNPQVLPYLCHYHRPAVIRREPVLNRLVQQLADRYPVLKQKLLADDDWATLLQPPVLNAATPGLWQRLRHKKTADNRPEALITGIPRSGTSYLCRILHNVRDCVVINEPKEIFAPLSQPFPPWQLALYHHDLRRQILDGQAIENKVIKGQVIEDTAVQDARNRYHPDVSRQDFLLCSKNTLAYLARVQSIRQVMPSTRLIACVRHPLDTIASWKGSFDHLKQAAVEQFPIGHPQDPALAGWQRDRLQSIAACQNAAQRRVLLWCYLAECVLAFRESLIVVNYETLVTQPEATLQQLLKAIPGAPPLQASQPLRPSEIRHKRELLDEEDQQWIQDMTQQYALELGYRL